MLQTGRVWRLTRFRALRTLYRRFSTETCAEGRAKKLLREWLSPEQRAQFDSLGYFEVRGCSTGKTYRVHHGTCANVLELDKSGAPKVGLCFVPAGHLAAGDVMLAQKIALETTEAMALATANRFPAQLPITLRRAAQRPY